MSLYLNSFQISEQNNNNDYNNNYMINNNEQLNISEIKERQINYAIYFFILHRIFTSFELRTKNL